MKTAIIIIFLALVRTTSYSQDLNTDSIMKTRKAEHIAGKITVSYTRGYRSKARVLQQAFENAAAFYEARYHKKFKLNLAVLDSNQWPAKEVPFGFMFYDSGWALIPAKITYNSFLHIYGLDNKRAEFEAFLKEKHVSASEMISSIYFVYALHELGHYFIESLEQEQVPDMFANEMIATYFSYNYFKSIHSKDLQNLIVFSKFIAENYNAKYHEIGAMDSLYTNMPMPNFKWYHCNIVLLCKAVHQRAGGSFIDYYLALFAKGKPNKFTTSEVVALLDKKAKGTMRKWVFDLAQYKPPVE
ncbi:MAG: hypothetical protein ACXVB0_14955 [Mucilaginibacter sp.]